MGDRQRHGCDPPRACTRHHALDSRGFSGDHSLARSIQCGDHDRFSVEQRRQFVRGKRDASHCATRAARHIAKPGHDPVACGSQIDDRRFIQRASPIERGQLTQAVAYGDRSGNRKAPQFAERGDRGFQEGRLHPSLRPQRALAREQEADARRGRGAGAFTCQSNSARLQLRQSIREFLRRGCDHRRAHRPMRGGSQCGGGISQFRSREPRGDPRQVRNLIR